MNEVTSRRSELSEGIAAISIMRDRTARSFVLPRYTPRNWMECDVFEITASDYFREYEVKLTLADFKADAAKLKEYGKYVYGQPRAADKKHDLLARGDPRGPVEFSFVAPVGLIDQIILPPWAGLIELHDRGDRHRPTFRWSPVVVVKAPRLHNEKIDPKVHPHALGNCYYRFHTAINLNANRQEMPVEWSDAPPETTIE